MTNGQTTQVLVVKGSGGGGLGDRLWSVLVAILYCRLSGRAIFVDWTDGLLAQQGINAFTELFSIQGVEVMLDLPDEEVSINPAAWSGRLRKSLLEVYVEDGAPPWDRFATIQRYSFDLAALQYPEKVLVMWDFDQLDRLKPHLESELKYYSDEDILRAVFQKHLIPHAELITEAELYLPSANATVGVHVRATREAAKQKGFVRLGDYFRLVDKLIASSDSMYVVLATDNEEVEEKFRRRYKDVVTRTKWFSRPGEPLHLNSECPNRLQNTRNALIEILMLARCAYLITQQNSSFSKIARLASRAPAENIFTLTSKMPVWKRISGYWNRVYKTAKNII